MTTTPGQRLVEELSKQLGPHMQWTEIEAVTLANIEAAADRLAVFRRRFDTLAADAKTPPHQLPPLSAECRLLEGAINRWAASLDPEDTQVKSARHVHAANMRWHRTSGS
jgi:hypothetical protein